MAINIIKQTSTVNTSVLSNRSIEYIIIHFTAGTKSTKGSAQDSCCWFNNSEAHASADYIVDDELFVQKNPDPKNRYCWAVGGSRYSDYKTTGGASYYGKATNRNSVSIEICSCNDTGKMTEANDSHYSFHAAAVNNAVTLTKYLMSLYNVPASRVIRHFDVNGKPCPGVKGWGTDGGSDASWKAFKAKLTSTSTATATTTTTTKDYLFQVRTKSDLNVRSAPELDDNIVGLAKQGTYRITKVSADGSWGYLYSKMGWIKITSKYATKI